MSVDVANDHVECYIESCRAQKANDLKRADYFALSGFSFTCSMFTVGLLAGVACRLSYFDDMPQGYWIALIAVLSFVAFLLLAIAAAALHWAGKIGRNA